MAGNAAGDGWGSMRSFGACGERFRRANRKLPRGVADLGEGDVGGALLRKRLGSGVDGAEGGDDNEICRNRLLGVVQALALSGVDSRSNTRGRVCV